MYQPPRARASRSANRRKTPMHRLTHVGGPIAVRGIAAGTRCALARFVIKADAAGDARTGVPLMSFGVAAMQEDP